MATNEEMTPEEKEASKKAVHTAAKAFATASTGDPQVGQIFDKVEHIPIIGKRIEKEEEKSANKLNRATSGKFGELANKMDKGGQLDAIDKAAGMGAGGASNPGGAGKAAGMGAGGAPNLGGAGNGPKKTGTGNDNQFAKTAGGNALTKKMGGTKGAIAKKIASKKGLPVPSGVGGDKKDGAQKGEEENSENLEEQENGETEGEQNGSANGNSAQDQVEAAKEVAKEMVKSKIKHAILMALVHASPYILLGIVIVALVFFLVSFLHVFIEDNKELLEFFGIDLSETGEAGITDIEANNTIVYEYSIVDGFYPTYGNSSCTILEEYTPMSHEYIVSKSEEGIIYSVSDGEVIYVNDKGINLYQDYDFRSKKCICNGVMCDNYNGSEVKIKIKRDDVEYIVTYSNLDKINVKVGDIVSKGDIIATEGNTGCVNSKRLTFKVVSENGISYNTNEFLKRCTSSNVAYDTCNFQNIDVTLVDSNNNYLKKVGFYDYIKSKLYRDFKEQINDKEVLKIASIIETTKVLRDNEYKVGNNNFFIVDSSYDVNISDEESKLLDNAINETINQALLYGNNFALANYSSSCNRGENDKNANSIYNELCLNEASKMDKTYEEIIKIYYPNYSLSKNYCSDYASKASIYKINNNKLYMSNEYSDELVEKYNNILETKINIAKYGTRASVVEAARFLALGLDEKIPFVNGGKYFAKGINKYWASEGLDSSGFVSWALYNGGANIEKDQNIHELITNNIRASLKIDSDFYNYYDQIQIGDFAYKDSKIGIIIGKKDGVLYVAESDIKEGLIVTEIKSIGISDSNYTHIYFAGDYYSGAGNLSNMW